MAESNGARAREAKRWLAQSKHDLEAAEANASAGRHALSCFLCHQSAEKAVAGFLFSRGAERVWGHALADLCEDAMAIDTSFDLIKTVAVLLDKFYLDTRYPSTLPGGVPSEAYDGHDSSRALEVARDVNEFVRQRIEEA